MDGPQAAVVHGVPRSEGDIWQSESTVLWTRLEKRQVRKATKTRMAAG
jgi:hypothetical protein